MSRGERKKLCIRTQELRNRRSYIVKQTAAMSYTFLFSLALWSAS